jgi:hypothetical protein
VIFFSAMGNLEEIRSFVSGELVLRKCILYRTSPPIMRVRIIGLAILV